MKECMLNQMPFNPGLSEKKTPLQHRALGGGILGFVFVCI